ncbi:MAG: signal recognition particle protein Srp54 [Candidatus Woesearchaeota archaeon]
MVLEKLGDRLKDTIGKIRSSLFVDEKLINDLIKDIQKALLQSDVNVRLVMELTQKIKKRALEEKASGGLSSKEKLITIVYEELVVFLGEETKPINLDKKPTKIMLVGLFGNGKTTTAGKLAKHYQKRGKKIALISTDTWRPAAFKQLQQTGEKIGVPVFGDPSVEDPSEIYKKFESELDKHDIIIIDTAGRDALSDDLISELNSINETVNADERILVIGADVGQAAEKQAKAFHDSCDVTGVIITKLEGTAKGGGALIACSISGAPVKFVGVGEKIDDLETFNPKGFVGRLLGMGDIEGLLEKAQEAVSAEEAKDMQKKFLKGEFNLIDLYEQMEAMSKMGSFGKIMEMMPGMGQLKMPKDALQVQEEKLKTWKYIMQSCTKEELETPDVINSSRSERIAKGSGRTQKEVRELVKQYKQSRKLMKNFKGMNAEDPKSMERMMKKMQKGGGKMKGFPGMK